MSFEVGMNFLIQSQKAADKAVAQFKKDVKENFVSTIDAYILDRGVGNITIEFLWDDFPELPPVVALTAPGMSKKLVDRLEKFVYNNSELLLDALNLEKIAPQRSTWTRTLEEAKNARKYTVSIHPENSVVP